MADASSVRFRGSVFLKLLVVFGLVLMLQIPVGRVESLIGERESNRAFAESEVRQSWGGVQCIEVPLLVVPYDEPSPWTRPADREYDNFAVLGAEDLDVSASVTSFVRTRGIFDVLLYDAELEIAGSITPPRGDWPQVPAENLQWEDAVLALATTPDRELPDVIEVGGRTLELQSGPFDSYVSVPLALGGPPEEAVSFRFTMRLRGSGGLLFESASGSTRASVEADWPHPKFVGALASEHEIDDGGFTARWQLRGGGRPAFSRWYGHEAVESSSGRNFGVELIQPVDSYRMARRSIKYEFLFTSLTLGMFFVLEVIGTRRVHVIQYLLVGGALVLFYLLVLSLSEHIGFGAAYGATSFAVVALVASYAVSALKSRPRGTAVGGLLLTLYAFLYVLLALQDFSLLVGSIGIFVILAVIMVASRRVDWYQLGKPR